ncbi:hypothetical protein H072_7057 [Dactylellina haptotyla CBS 200.50]|uniref:C2H2-type domain-containing protein n=1 Tax=Dactylellina haptotyla (strain CBS 200.50) TaxID=1284197 RepID=S8BIM3_DACHA|nr:hypothetical protein H072_7057 [Dactylellina haptotyla CBS 200.50]
MADPNDPARGYYQTGPGLNTSEMTGNMSKRPLEESCPKWSTCSRCNTEFFSVDRAQEHFENMCPDLWCDLCKEAFKEAADTRKHMEFHADSSLVCPRCKLMAPTAEDLFAHWRVTNCHIECKICGAWFFKESFEVHYEMSPFCRRALFTRDVFGTQNFPSSNSPASANSPQKRTGLENRPVVGIPSAPGQNENPRGIASQSFQTPNNTPSKKAAGNLNFANIRPENRATLGKAFSPKKARSSHQKGLPRHHDGQKSRKRVSCFGCDRYFPIYSSMVLHLESGNCDSRISIEDINYVFATHPRSEELMVDDGRKSLIAFLNYQTNHDGTPFKCSNVTCNSRYKYLSALINHSEGAAFCNLRFGDSTTGIMKHLEIHLYRQSLIHSIDKVRFSRASAIFIRPPPSSSCQEFQQDPEPWRPLLVQLIDSLLSLTDLVLIGEPGRQYSRVLNFNDLSRARTVLTNLTTSIGRVQHELARVAKCTAQPKLPGIASVLLHFKETGETQTVTQFVKNVERVRDMIRLEYDKRVVSGPVLGYRQATNSGSQIF